ncbi:ABC transporter ATP-binding protein [Thermovibrio sp.]
MVKVKAKKELKGFKLNVEFKSKEMTTSLFAPSGSGKSLTLKTISGVLTPDEGYIYLKGRVLFDSERGINLPPQKRKVGYLPQDYALFPHLTVLENAKFGEKRKGVAEEILKRLKIWELKDKYPDQISGGQKQRTALARALAAEPELLLLDEPFSALDKGLKEELYKEIKTIQSEFQIPIILVSHDIDEVFELSEWLVVIKDGKSSQEGKPQEVFLNPKDLQTARLLGQKSLIEGVVKEVSKFTVVELPSGKKLKCRKGDFKKGEKVFISLLPFSVALSLEKETNRIKVKVLNIKEGRETLKITGIFEEKEVEFHLPKSLKPNFTIETGREATFYLCPEQIPVVRRRNEEES